MKSILDRTFRYTPSAQTDLRKTFARVRKEQRCNTTVPDASNPAVSAAISTPITTERYSKALAAEPVLRTKPEYT